MSIVREPFECWCGCHDARYKIRHCMPCCVPCSICKRNIKHGFGKSHETQCREEYDKLIKVAEEALRALGGEQHD